MNISNITIAKKLGQKKISANIGPYSLWFKFSDKIQLQSHDATPFLTSALLPAMLLGEDIIVDEKYTVSEKLLIQLNTIQEIFNSWNPIFKFISITAATKKIVASDLSVSCFFSGGVDGSYSLIKHKETIENLVLINGFDFDMDAITWQNMISRNVEIAKISGKRLITVETNLKAFTTNFYMARFVNFGASLASVGQLLNASTFYLSAATTYGEIHRSGSHPLLDSLWSTESCEFHHTGLEANRIQKIALIKQFPEILANLWVCWKDPKVNCGRCSKCVRTYISLLLSNTVGIPFAQQVRLSDIKKISIKSKEELSFFEAFYDAAEKNDMKEVKKYLAILLIKSKGKSFLRLLDRLLLNSIFQRWQKRRLGLLSQLTDISLELRYTDSHMQEQAKLKYHQE